MSESLKPYCTSPKNPTISVDRRLLGFIHAFNSDLRRCIFCSGIGFPKALLANYVHIFQHSKQFGVSYNIVQMNICKKHHNVVGLKNGSRLVVRTKKMLLTTCGLTHLHRQSHKLKYTVYMQISPPFFLSLDCALIPLK